MSLRESLIFALSITFLSPCLFAAEASDRAEKEPTAIGRKVDEFTLDNCYGSPVSLSDFDDKKAIAIVFLGTECPLAKLYGPRLAELQADYRSKGVQFIGVNSNRQDSMTELASYQKHCLEELSVIEDEALRTRENAEFPMLKDVGNRVADAMGAERTPEVFLLDADHVIRFHGRIDDQLSVGLSRPDPNRRDLAMAIDELLAGKPISVPETEAEGCHIGRVKEMEATGAITYTEHIAAIFNARCVSCHREQEIAPFTLESYDDVLGWEDTILEVIDDQRMPPWFANPDHGTFANDARMTEKEKELIATWVDNGMPQGDPDLLPDPPKFVVGWQIPKPDQVIPMNKSEENLKGVAFKVNATDAMDYEYFVVDPGWNEDKYVYAAQAKPGNRSVVHHILAYIIPPGTPEGEERKHRNRVLAGYAPGALPTVLEDGVAIKVAAGSKLLFQMHYTPNGRETTDLSSIGVCFTDRPDDTKLLRGRIAIEHNLQIPANDSAFEVPAYYSVKQDEMLISMTPHMHLRGKAFRYTAVFPDGTEDVLLDVPNYDFNWQLKYILEEPILLPRKTVIKCEAVYDNSETNLALTADQRNKEVKWGDQSDEEMMIGFMDTLPVTNANRQHVSIDR